MIIKCSSVVLIYYKKYKSVWSRNITFLATFMKVNISIGINILAITSCWMELYFTSCYIPIFMLYDPIFMLYFLPMTAIEALLQFWKSCDHARDAISLKTQESRQMDKRRTSTVQCVRYGIALSSILLYLTWRKSLTKLFSSQHLLNGALQIQERNNLYN